MEPIQSVPESAPTRRRRLAWVLVPVMVVALVAGAAWALPGAGEDRELAAGALNDPQPNPTLKSCNKVLVSYDMSASIGLAGHINDVKSAVKGLIGAFKGTPAQVKAVGWASTTPFRNGQPVSNLAPVNDQTQPFFNAMVDGSPFPTGIGVGTATNHEAAFRWAYDDGAPNLMIMITDGKPTRAGYPNATLGNGSEYGINDPRFQQVANPAINAANGLKLFGGTRILTVAVGDDNFFGVGDYFERLSPGARYATSNWGLLGLFLANLVKGICPGGGGGTTTTAPPPPPPPAISVTTQVPAEVPEASPFTYTITVCNAGAQPLKNVKWTNNRGRAGSVANLNAKGTAGDCQPVTGTGTVPDPYPSSPDGTDFVGRKYPFGVTTTATGDGVTSGTTSATDSQTTQVVSRGPRPT
ncbi:MAG: hypothetical protein ACOYNI_10415 [Acidimicrobiia bacterium]